MKSVCCAVSLCVGVFLGAVSPVRAGMPPNITKCPPDAVLVGRTCVDKYEASAWLIPAMNAGNSNAGLIKNVRNGKATEADLTAGGATLLSPSSSCTPGFPANFPPAGDAVNTGSRSACVSQYGAFDMVGNVDEWVSDWVPQSTACGSWSGSSDFQCLAGAATSGEPGALVRGGSSFGNGSDAGPFTVDGTLSPSDSFFGIGFRCAR